MPVIQRLIQNKIFALLLLLGLGLLLYGRVLGYGYIWDDIIIFQDRTDLMGPFSWAVIARPVLPDTSYFRPLVLLTFYLEFWFTKGQPWLSHLVNLSLYLLNVSLVYALARALTARLTGQVRAGLSLLAALLYALHPSISETTIWVVGRFDQMVCLWLLLASLLYVRGQDRPALRWGIPVCFLLALLSKELGIILPGLLFVLYAAGQPVEQGVLKRLGGFLQQEFRLLAAMLLVLGGYFVLRIQAMHQVYHASLSAEYYQQLWHNLLPLHALAFYVREALLPFATLSILHPMDGYLGQPASAYWLAVTLLAVAGLVTLYWRAPAWRAVLWLWLGALGALLPVLHLIPLETAGNIGHDRFMTTALAFFALGFALMPVQRLQPAQLRLAGLVGGSWVLLALFTLYTVVPMWQSELKIWAWTYRLYPDSELAKRNYMAALQSSGHIRQLEQLLLEIRQKKHGFDAVDQVNYANLLTAIGNPEALPYFEGIVQVLPKFHEMPDGRARLARGFELQSPDISSLYFGYASALILFKGDLDQAAHYNQVAGWYVLPAQRWPVLYQQRGIIYLRDGPEKLHAFDRQFDDAIYYRRLEYRKSIVNTVLGYCARFGQEKPACQRSALEQSGL